MIFNGHTHDTIATLDEVTMQQIQTMYADGLIGNRGIIEALGNLTAGVFNYMRPANSSSYKLATIIGNTYDYFYPPLTPEQQKQKASDSLKIFMSMAPGFKEKFNG